MAIAKNLIKFFGPLFSAEPKVFETVDNFTIDVFDIPTQLFIYSERSTAIYGRISEELESVVYKIIKENGFSELIKTTTSLEHITQFRRVFWKHPEVEAVLAQAIIDAEVASEIEALNVFFQEMIHNKIWEDEQLSKLREFRIYIAKKSISFDNEISSDLRNDLRFFLEFDRFNTDNYIKKRANEEMDRICNEIQEKRCPDLRYMKSYKDRDAVPNLVVDRIEKLVLINYCDKPDKKTVNEIRGAAEKMDLAILKKYLNFNPVGWQKYALIFESRENLAANCRRSGKSFLMVYIAIRQIFLPGQMILYILPVKEDYSEQPFFYIEQMVENISKEGAELLGFQFNSKLFKCVNKTFKSKIIFISAQGSSKGKSFSANLVIIDEAAYIDSANIYDQASNSTSDTKGRMRAVSTINVDVPINRFFYKKISLDGMEDAKVISIDIYNNPFMSESEIQRKEIQFKNKNQNVWLADWMAIFVGGVEGFDVSKFFKIDFIYDVITFKGCKFNLARNLDKYNRFMLAYDPAKNMDKAGISIIGLVGNKAEVVLTGYINIKNYYLQWEVILDIIEYIKKIRECESAIDLGKAGEAAFDYFEARKVSPYGILSTGGNTVKKETFRRWNVPAEEQEKTLHSLLSAGVVKGFSWLDNIRNEFETYNLSKERKGNVGHHHDVLSSLMMAVFIWYERKLIGFDKQALLKVQDNVQYDSNGLPINKYVTGKFTGEREGRFMH